MNSRHLPASLQRAIHLRQKAGMKNPGEQNDIDAANMKCAGHNLHKMRLTHRTTSKHSHPNAKLAVCRSMQNESQGHVQLTGTLSGRECPLAPPQCQAEGRRKRIEESEKMWRGRIVSLILASLT